MSESMWEKYGRPRKWWDLADTLGGAFCELYKGFLYWLVCGAAFLAALVTMAVVAMALYFVLDFIFRSLALV